MTIFDQVSRAKTTTVSQGNNAQKTTAKNTVKTCPGLLKNSFNGGHQVAPQHGSADITNKR